MALIPFGFMPRSMFDMDMWMPPKSLDFGMSSLDLFDPFDELDQMMSRNLMWLKRPSFMQSLLPTLPSFPEKYRVSVDCAGFDPKSIKLDTNSKTLYVSAHEEDRIDSQNYSVREFKKTYELPANAEVDKLASFVAPNGQLVVEVPLKDTQLTTFDKSEFFPKYSDDGKMISMSFSLPAKIDKSKISVTLKDQDIVVRAEEKVERNDRMSHLSYYKRSTLPQNADLNAIQCHMDGNKLTIKAPVISDTKSISRQIPIAVKNY